MKITRIRAWALDLPFRDGAYRCRNRTEHGMASTIVALSTDAGPVGWGEVAPLGAFYSEAFAGGVRAGLAVLAPELLGRDPRGIDRIVAAMDGAMMGQQDVKTPLDMALWDLAGKIAGLPLVTLLGGQDGQGVPLYRSISQAGAEAMAARARAYREAGYGRLQVKVGEDPRLDAERLAAVVDAVGPGVPLYCDANGAWTSHEALRFLEMTRAFDYVLEQPCASLSENRIVRQRCTKPFVLDESVDSIEALLAIARDGAADGVTIKIARFGGITRARRARDLALDFGMMVTVEDIGGAEIDTAAIAALCLSMPEARRTHTVDFHNWVSVSNAAGFPAVAGGRMAAPQAPGLGIVPLETAFGAPFLDLSA